jgi:phospholipid transport system substrate-binding protein
MRRRVFLIAPVALFCAPRTGAAAATAPDARKFIEDLGRDVIRSLTGKTLSEALREQHFQALLDGYFDVPGASKFVLARYWRQATDQERSDFQRLFEKLLVQSYAKIFAEYNGERFEVIDAKTSDDGSAIVGSQIDRLNGDVIHLDWRVEERAGQLRITDLIVEGMSMRITHRSDIASAMQNVGGKVSALLDALRQKTGSQ